MKVVRRRCAGRTSSAQVAGCAIVAVCAGMFAGSATADDQWMSEDAMRQTFAGVTLDGKYGSGRPFTETYDKDGRLEYRGAIEGALAAQERVDAALVEHHYRASHGSGAQGALAAYLAGYLNHSVRSVLPRQSTSSVAGLAVVALLARTRVPTGSHMPACT